MLALDFAHSPFVWKIEKKKVVVFEQHDQVVPSQFKA